MLITIIKTIFAIICLIVSSFLSYNAKKQWQKYAWYLCFVLAIALIVEQSFDTLTASGELRRVQERLSNIQEYGEVATWNFRGDQSISKDFSLPSKLSGWTDGFVKDQDGKKVIRYDEEAIAHYKNVMSKYPRYPFSYYLLAEAYRLRNDSIWRKYAIEAVKILEITTACPVHAPNHDEVLRNLKTLLNSGNPGTTN